MLVWSKCRWITVNRQSPRVNFIYVTSRVYCRLIIRCGGNIYYLYEETRIFSSLWVRLTTFDKTKHKILPLVRFTLSTRSGPLDPRGFNWRGNIQAVVRDEGGVPKHSFPLSNPQFRPGSRFAYDRRE